MAKGPVNKIMFFDSHHNQISRDQEQWAVILCGGQGSRLGKLTQDLPKPLVKVGGKPILSFIFDELTRQGFNRLVLPAGYLSHEIRNFTQQYQFPEGTECFVRDTGMDSPIGSRLAQIWSLLPPDADVLMTNGDLLFNFDLKAFKQEHQCQNNLITFASTTVHSPFGLLHFEDGSLKDFSRDDEIESMNTCNNSSPGLVYSGICIFNASAFDFDRIEQCANFEAEVFPDLISTGRAGHFVIDGFWHPIDTPKDLKSAESLFKP